MAQQELVMVKNKFGIWEDIYDVSKSIHLSITNSEDAIKYVEQVYGDRFTKCPLEINEEQTELYALIPNGFALKQINPGNKLKGT